MKLIANGINGRYLRECLPGPDAEVDRVWAAVAYGSLAVTPDNNLVQQCIDRRYRLDLWMRYDHTVPVAIPLLKKLKASATSGIYTRLVPDVLHAKVIWWVGHGAYIGSANLTDRAWTGNIEAGLFLDEGSLKASGVESQLEEFFRELASWSNYLSIDDNLIAEMQRLQAKHAEFDKQLRALRKTEEGKGPSFVSRVGVRERELAAFRKEWSDCRAILDGIASKLKTNWPSWISRDVPMEWHVDQFLHAYYYNHVRVGVQYPVDPLFERNNKDPSAALDAELEWWRNTAGPPSNEDTTFNETAPLIRRLLARELIQRMTIEDTVALCRATHATKDYVRKMPLEVMGITGRTSLDIEQRLERFGAWMHARRNARGESLAQLLEYVLYGGPDSDTWQRIFEAARDENRAIGHYGLSSVAEVVGWARPEVAYPRNGRTSKALRALGFDVRVY